MPWRREQNPRGSESEVSGLQETASEGRAGAGDARTSFFEGRSGK